MIDSSVTVLIPTSSIQSHPSTAIIRETIASVRHHLPTAEIRILCDGIRPEFEHRRPQYVQYLFNLTGEVDEHTFVRTFDEHSHQSTMVKLTLPSVTTPLVLWTEHDQALLTDADRPIDWQMISGAITAGAVELVRLMLTETINPLHEYLYSGPVDGYPQLLRNRQYSGWTHLASTEFYRRMLANFDTRAKMTIERYCYGFIETAGDWNKWKMASYIPDPERTKRIRHLDGRAGPGPNGTPRDPSFEELEVYPPRG